MANYLLVRSAFGGSLSALAHVLPSPQPFKVERLLASGLLQRLEHRAAGLRLPADGKFWPSPCPM